jgi:type I restriction enzyme S subunit
MNKIASAGKYVAYPEYKYSGVEWLGVIPIDWELWKLNHAYDEIGSGTTPPSGSDEWYGGDVPWITTGELREKEIVSTTKNVTLDTLRIFPTLRKYPKGSIAIAMYGATIGRLGIFGVEATTNQACCVLTKSDVVDNKYLYYWLQAFKRDIVNLASGGGQPNINQEVVASLKISSPNLSGQKTIANFLDHETAKIDTLIEKQQQLIKLLKEKRQAVISHAVTKGLNPDAAMKDSGVEWLGEVPEHWLDTEIRYITRQMGGGTPSKENTNFWNGHIPWVSPKDMKVDYINDAQDKITVQAVQESSTKLIPSGSILIVVRGMILVHSVPVALTQREITINQDMKALIPVKGVDGEFLLFFMKGLRDFILDLVEESAHGTKCLRSEVFDRMKIAIPKIEEQIEIVAQLKRQMHIVDSLIEKAHLGIELLGERRTALISAAVTGKIDVRHFTSINGSAPKSSSSQGTAND